MRTRGNLKKAGGKVKDGQGEDVAKQGENGRASCKSSRRGVTRKEEVLQGKHSIESSKGEDGRVRCTDLRRSIARKAFN